MRLASEGETRPSPAGPAPRSLQWLHGRRPSSVGANQFLRSACHDSTLCIGSRVDRLDYALFCASKVQQVLPVRSRSCQNSDIVRDGEPVSVNRIVWATPLDDSQAMASNQEAVSCAGVTNHRYAQASFTAESIFLKSLSWAVTGRELGILRTSRRNGRFGHSQAVISRGLKSLPVPLTLSLRPCRDAGRRFHVKLSDVCDVLLEDCRLRNLSGSALDNYKAVHGQQVLAVVLQLGLADAVDGAEPVHALRVRADHLGQLPVGADHVGRHAVAWRVRRASRGGR